MVRLQKERGMPKKRDAVSPDKVSLDTALIDVYLTGLQAEVEAKLRRVRKFREQLQRIAGAGGQAPRRVSMQAAQALLTQADEMLDTNRIVRETLHELRDAARALIEDLAH